MIFWQVLGNESQTFHEPPQYAVRCFSRVLLLPLRPDVAITWYQRASKNLAYDHSCEPQSKCSERYYGQLPHIVFVIVFAILAAVVKKLTDVVGKSSIREIKNSTVQMETPLLLLFGERKTQLRQESKETSVEAEPAARVETQAALSRCSTVVRQ